MARLVIAVAAAITCMLETCGMPVDTTLTKDSHMRPASPNWSSFDMMNDYGGVSLIQTDMHVAPTHRLKPVGAYTQYGGNVCGSSASGFGKAAILTGVLQKMWLWVVQVDQCEATAKHGIEASKQFHKDFIAAALLITCVFPWSRRSASIGGDPRRVARNRLWLMLPSGQTLRLLSVFLLWLKHYWLEAPHASLEIMFFLVGLVFDFVDEHDDGEDDMWQSLGHFVPERFSKLYPFYAFHVVVCYLAFFSSSCTAFESLLGGNLLLAYSCGLVAWLMSVVFACYLVVLVMTSPPRHLEPSSMAMLCAGCVAMVVLPRTLAAPVHGPWAWSQDNESSLLHSGPDGVAFELFFARRSLLLGLAHFFFGLALARARLALNTRKPQLEMASDVVQEEHSTGSSEAELWGAFEDEAQRDMLRSLSSRVFSD